MAQGSNDEVYVWEGYRSAEPQCISSFIGYTGVRTVSFGNHHAALLMQDGRLFVYGSNKCGQLGLGSTDIEYIPPEKLAQVPFGNLLLDFTLFAF